MKYDFPGEVFMDVGDIQAGEDFVAVLHSQAKACDVLLAVIGPQWADAMAARATDLDDFVVIEIKAALDSDKRVIPVLVGGAKMPLPAFLPDSIRALARRHAVDVTPRNFEADGQRLVAALKEQFAATEAFSVDTI